MGSSLKRIGTDFFTPAFGLIGSSGHRRRKQSLSKRKQAEFEAKDKNLKEREERLASTSLLANPMRTKQQAQNANNVPVSLLGG